MLRATVADDAAHSPRLHPIRSFFVCEESARRRRRRLQRGSPSAAQTAAMTAGKWRAWAMSERTTWGKVGETRTTRARDKPKVGCVVSKLLPENRANKRLALALQPSTLLVYPPLSTPIYFFQVDHCVSQLNVVSMQK
jgi:hypothetical protein